MAELTKKLATRLERSTSGSDGELDALYEVFEALGRAFHRYELLSIDRLYAELTDPARDPAFQERASRPGSALWGLRELLRSFLALFPSPVEPLARWNHGSFMGQLVCMLAEAPGSVEELRARLRAPMGAVEDAVGELRGRGLLANGIAGDAQLELSDAGLRVDAFLRRAHFSPLREMRRERYGDWTERAEQMLRQSDPSARDELYRLLWEFGPALELARRDAEALPRAPSIAQLLDDLRHKLSVKRVAELELVLLTQPELEWREGSLPEGSTIWVAGVEPPNGSVFRKTVCKNIRDRRCRYIYLCSETSFQELYAYVEPRVGTRDSAERLICITAPEICGVGRFYNVTTTELGPGEGWMAHWIGKRERPDAPKGGAFYSRVGDEYLSRMTEKLWKCERELRARSAQARQRVDRCPLPL